MNQDKIIEGFLFIFGGTIALMDIRMFFAGVIGVGISQLIIGLTEVKE